MPLFFSFIIPVYNRPQELKELLQSLSQLQYEDAYEVVIVEDGSQEDAESILEEFRSQLTIQYLKKPNTGPGDSRNYGMRRAKGNYFIILDSDCLLPRDYLLKVAASLDAEYVDCYGGPDTAHDSFSATQKAINYAMTSAFSTGGIRGSKRAVGKFQPRSFNMGISKKAFESTEGFGSIHPGEDPDLSIRLWKKGFSTKLIPEAYVFHKRRIAFKQFFKQVTKFGKVRPILNLWHPGTAKITYWFPTLFCLGFLISVALLFVLPWPYNIVPMGIYLLYFILIFFDALVKTKNLWVGFSASIAVAIQFAGYGLGFLKSTILVNFTRRKPQEIFPELFF
ncbi:MAG: glycosyltransferase family 2 protein [Flavobacteriaceae bacterium]